MPRLEFFFRDQSIEVGGVYRVVSSGDRVRLVGEGGEQVAARDTAEVVSVQEVEEPDDRARLARFSWWIGGLNLVALAICLTWQPPGVS